MYFQGRLTYKGGLQSDKYGNLLKANCVRKEEYDIIIKTMIN